MPSSIFFQEEAGEGLSDWPIKNGEAVRVKNKKIHFFESKPFISFLNNIDHFRPVVHKDIFEHPLSLLPLAGFSQDFQRQVYFPGTDIQRGQESDDFITASEEQKATAEGSLDDSVSSFPGIDLDPVHEADPTHIQNERIDLLQVSQSAQEIIPHAGGVGQ